MKNQTTGTQFVPSFRSTQDVNTLQERYFRSMTDCEVKTDIDRWYVAVIFKKLSAEVCRFKKNHHLCSVFHLIRARRLAIIAAGIFYACQSTYSSVPCGALMRPLPLSGGRQRGAELFCSLPVDNQHIVSFLHVF